MGSFQCWGVLLIWIIVGYGPTVFAVGAGGLAIFSLSCHFSFVNYGVIVWYSTLSSGEVNLWFYGCKFHFPVKQQRSRETQFATTNQMIYPLPNDNFPYSNPF